MVRKYEQEIDSLTFRNQQLSARVTILQDDLEQPASEQKGKKNKVSISNTVFSAIDTCFYLGGFVSVSALNSPLVLLEV